MEFPYGYRLYGYMDYVWPYGNKFGLRLQYRLPDLGLAIYQQPLRLVTSQGTQAQLVVVASCQLDTAISRGTWALWWVRILRYLPIG